MRVSCPLRDQIDQMQRDPQRIVISGAGVAGITLAQLLRRHGLHPTVMERTDPTGDEGYMIGLVPLDRPAFVDLGVEDAYRDHSVQINSYTVCGRHGRRIRTFSFPEVLGSFGEYRGLSHGTLLDVLSASDAPVSFGTTISALEQHDDGVTVTFADGSVAEVDTLVVAEGIHSTTRDLVVSPGQVTTFDSGWGGWVTWIDPDDDMDTYEEVWGARFFIGTYPVQGKIGVLVGGDRRDTRTGPREFVSRIRDELAGEDSRVRRGLEAVAGADGLYFWTFSDIRSDQWTFGRVELLGDTATGFLPTAGIGAGMAIESAHQLALFLRDVKTGDVPAALRAFEASQRPRVISAQANSRTLARLMFRRSTGLAVVRDTAIRFMPLRMVLGPIRKLIQTGPGHEPGVR